MNILVTDGNSRSALAVTRSLGKKGHKIIVTATSSSSLAAASRYCSQSIATPDPLANADAYAATIREVAVRENIDCIYPMTEQSIYCLNPYRDDFTASTILACPPQPMMAYVSDKLLLCKTAEELQVPIPKTIYVQKAAELSKYINQIENYPVVIKPARSKVQVGNTFLSGGVRYAHDKDELQRIYKSSPILQFPSLIQEKIIGPGTGLFTLFDRNRHLVLFSHKRLREKPPSGGVSVVCESVPLDLEMVAAAERLLAAVGWVGVAMVEFKRDYRDGRAKLMEINGRFWGSLQLAISCGVDFPALLLDHLQGTHISPEKIGEYSTGKQLKWFLGTLDHLIICMKKGSPRVDSNGKPKATRWRALHDFACIWEKNTTFDVFSREDRGPFIHESMEYVKEVVKRFV